MKEVTITINERDICERIFTESGHTAFARSKAGLPEGIIDIIQATDDDNNILRGFINDSIDEAANIINRYLSPCSVKNKEEDRQLTCITFTLPSNSPESIVATLKNCITRFSVARSLQYWTLNTKPDEANTHISKAQSELVRMRELLSTRTRPTKETEKENNIIEL